MPSNAVLLLLFRSSKTQRLRDFSKTETAEKFVNTQTAEESVDETTESETVQQFADKTEDACQQETNGGDDLEQGLGQQAPEGTETFLGVRHIGDLLLRVVNCLDDGGGELFERVGQRVFFRRGFMISGACLGVGGDTAVRIKTSNGAVAFLQNAATFFDHRLHILD